MSLNHGARIVTDGLVLCLDAANPKSYPGSGTTWSDVSGNSNDGTLTNGPTFGSDNSGTIVFDGSNDYIEGVHNTQLDLTGSMTAEVWFKLTGSPSDWVRILGKGDSTNRTFGLWYNTSSNYFLYQRYGTSNMNAAGGTISTNTWYHLVGTSSGNSHVLYLNGESIGTSSTGTTFYSSTATYKVGYAGYHTYHLGNVANCKLYNRGLTSSEVQQNYNAIRGRFGL